MKKTVIFLILAAFAITAQAQNAKAILDKADSLSAAKNYTEAIALLEKNLNVFEKDTTFDVSFAYDRLKNYYYSIADYKNANLKIIRLIWRENMATYHGCIFLKRISNKQNISLTKHWI